MFKKKYMIGLLTCIVFNFHLSYTMNLEELREAAQCGDVVCQMELAQRYYDGRGVVKNYPQAVKWFARAAEQGHVEAQLELANCYCEGYGIEKNAKKAFGLVAEAAKKGGPKAQFALGCCYYEGSGVSRSFSMAVDCFEKAAEQGHVKAQYNLGLLFMERGNIKRSDFLDLKWLKFELTGFKIEENISEALKWLTMAAKQQHQKAAFNLAGLYYKVGKRNNAYRWLSRAAKLGHSRAMFQMARYAYNNAHDKEKALEWLIQAAKHGDKESQVLLATGYETGKFSYPFSSFFFQVQQDIELAIKWYVRTMRDGYLPGGLVRLAESGNVSAQMSLAEVYYHGKGVAQDYAEAVKWYHLAAGQGDTVAQCTLADCYINGRGVNCDTEQAQYYFSLASESGNREAKRERAFLFLENANMHRAAELLVQAAEQGDAQAQSLKDLFLKFGREIKHSPQARGFFEDEGGPSGEGPGVGTHDSVDDWEEFLCMRESKNQVA